MYEVINDNEQFADATRNDVPAVSSLVEFRESERQGRHSVAAAPIPCGAVLAVDRPITALLNPGDPRDVFQFCLHCLRRVGRGAVVPCGRCSSVVFCSRFGEFTIMAKVRLSPVTVANTNT